MPFPAAPLGQVGPPDFKALFSREFSYVWGTLRRLGVAASDLEDLCQQVFLAVHQHLPAYDPRLPLRPWLFGFAFRAASNYRRLARHRFERFGEEAELADPRVGADERLITRERLARTELALLKVELDRRAVLLLHEVDGHTMPEIAEALGLALNTAYSRLRLARQDFQAAYRRLQLQGGNDESA